MLTPALRAHSKEPGLQCQLVRTTLAALLVFSLPAFAAAQVTPAAGSTPPDDTPSIRVGVVFYGDYTYTQSPKTTDSDGNSIHLSQFNVSRTYLNITGNASHIVAFRITPDVSRETGSGASLAGSLEYRIKYAFVQFNLDDWMARGSWVRLGIQQTPWLDFEENVYRYRFQGAVFAEREGYLSSSDAGASFHYNLPSNYGEIHAGVYNGETYSKVEVNNEKAFQFRGSLRPFTTRAPVLRGLRAHLFYDADNYVKNAERRRAIGSVTFEHQYLNAGFDYLGTKDQTSVTKPDVGGRGYSIWATPRSSKGWEALLRYDHLTPNSSTAPISPIPEILGTLNSQKRTRAIMGVAYWFPHQGTVSAALLLDYDSTRFEHFIPSQPNQTRIALHGLVSF